MKYDELSAELGLEAKVLDSAILANGFSSDDDFDAPKQNLVNMYADYLIAMEDAKEQRLAFKYMDGEESVDKSKVYEQYRRYAIDLLNLWRDQKKAYDDSFSGKDSFFSLRTRAGFLDGRNR